MISKKRWKNTVFHIEQKTDFEKFNCFFVNFLKYSFGRIKFISTVVEREYTPDTPTDLLCISIGWSLHDKRFYWTVFPDYSYILENHIYFMNAPDYCFKPSLFRIFCVNSTVKVLSPLYEGPSTHLFRISSLCL